MSPNSHFSGFGSYMSHGGAGCCGVEKRSFCALSFMQGGVHLKTEPEHQLEGEGCLQRANVGAVLSYLIGFRHHI